MKRVIVSVTNDLVTDQRVHRSCMALYEAGYDVTLVGRLLPGSVPVERPYHTERMSLLFRKKAVFYAEYNIRLFLKLLFSRADVFYANDTDALPANWLAAVLLSRPIFFDAHEMFPEVPELMGRPQVKHVWSAIEDHIFPRLARRRHAAAVTVCQSIADIYKDRYGLKMNVVRNVPMFFPVDDVDVSDLLAPLPQGKRIVLYQGAVNIGRGLEWVIDAMPYVDNAIFVVAGVGDIYDTLVAHVRARKELHDKVFFLGRLSPSRLHALTVHADLGLQLPENRGLNYYYSLPNRIADYVQAGVPVLATDFPEIHRVVCQYGVGTLVPPQPFDARSMRSEAPDPKQLAATICEALDYWRQMPSAEREARFAKARADLSWDNDKKILLSSFDTIF